MITKHRRIHPIGLVLCLLLVPLAASAAQECQNDPVIQQLAHQSMTQRQRAATALLQRGAGALPGLFCALKSHRWRLRDQATRVLGQLGKKGISVVQVLTHMLQDPEPWVRETALEAIGKLGPRASAALPDLKRIASNTKPEHTEQRLWAVWALKQLGTSARPALKLLRQRMTDKDRRIQRLAKTIVKQLNPHPSPKSTNPRPKTKSTKKATHRPLLERLLRPDHTPTKTTIKRLLTHHQAPTRRAGLALLLMQTKAPTDHIPTLLKMLHKRTPKEQSDVVNLLARIKDKAASKKIVMALAGALSRKGSPSTQQRLLRLMRSYGDTSLSAYNKIKPLLHHKRPQVRLETLRLFRQWGPKAKASMPSLIQILRKTDRLPIEHRHAIDLIAGLGAQAKIAIPTLIQMAGRRGQSGAVIQKLKRTLEHVGAPLPTQQPLLLKLMEHKSKHVRALAAAGLSRMGASIAPRLIAGLKTWRKPVKKALIQALIQLGSPALPQLLQAVKKGNWSQRKAAAKALQRIKPTPAQVALLLRELQTKPPRRTTKAIIRLLGNAGANARSAVPTLRQQLRKRRVRHRWLIVDALGKIGPPAAQAMPELSNMLRWKSWRVRRRVARTIGKMGGGVVPALAELIRTGNWRSRSGASRALGLIGEPAIPTLQKLLQHRKWTVRVSAAQALKKMGTKAKAAVSSLMRAMFDRKWRVRRAARRALLRLDASTLLPIARRMLRSGSITRRRQAAYILSRMGTPAQAAARDLLNALQHKHIGLKLSCIAALGRLRIAAAIPALERTLQSGPLKLRIAAADAIGRIGAKAKKQLPTLIKLYNDASQPSQLRAKAIESLGRIASSPKLVVPILHKAVQDKEPTIRAEAAWSLGKMGRAALASTPLLLKILQQNNSEDDKTKIKYYTLLTLGRIRPTTPAAIDVLASYTQQPKKLGRAARQALLKIGKPAIKHLVSKHKKAPSPELQKLLALLQKPHRKTPSQSKPNAPSDQIDASDPEGWFKVKQAKDLTEAQKADLLRTLINESGKEDYRTALRSLQKLGRFRCAVESDFEDQDPKADYLDLRNKSINLARKSKLRTCNEGLLHYLYYRSASVRIAALKALQARGVHRTWQWEFILGRMTQVRRLSVRRQMLALLLSGELSFVYGATTQIVRNLYLLPAKEQQTIIAYFVRKKLKSNHIQSDLLGFSWHASPQIRRQIEQAALALRWSGNATRQYWQAKLESAAPSQRALAMRALLAIIPKSCSSYPYLLQRYHLLGAGKQKTILAALSRCRTIPRAMLWGLWPKGKIPPSQRTLFLSILTKAKGSPKAKQALLVRTYKGQRAVGSAEEQQLLLKLRTYAPAIIEKLARVALRSGSSKGKLALVEQLSREANPSPKTIIAVAALLRTKNQKLRWKIYETLENLKAAAQPASPQLARVFFQVPASERRWIANIVARMRQPGAVHCIPMWKYTIAQKNPKKSDVDTIAKSCLQTPFPDALQHVHGTNNPRAKTLLLKLIQRWKERALPLFPTVRKLLSHASNKQRPMVYRALHSMGLVAARKLLKLYLAPTTQPAFRSRLTPALLGLKSTDFHKIWSAEWSLSSQAQRGRLLHLLGRAGPRGYLALGTVTKQLAGPLRLQAIRALGEWGWFSRTAATRLKPLLRSANPSLQKAAINALGAMRLRSARTWLRGISAPKALVAQALAKLAAPDTAPKLQIGSVYNTSTPQTLPTAALPHPDIKTKPALRWIYHPPPGLPEHSDQPTPTGNLLLQCLGGYILAIDARYGRIRWTYQGTGKAKVRSYLGRHKQTIYIFGSDGIIRGLDAETGKAQWKYTTTSTIVYVFMRQRALFMQTKDNHLRIIELGTYRKRLELKLRGTPISDLYHKGHRLLYFYRDKKFVHLGYANLRTRRQWTRRKWYSPKNAKSHAFELPDRIGNTLVSSRKTESCGKVCCTETTHLDRTTLFQGKHSHIQNQQCHVHLNDPRPLEYSEYDDVSEELEYSMTCGGKTWKIPRKYGYPHASTRQVLYTQTGSKTFALSWQSNKHLWQVKFTGCQPGKWGLYCGGRTVHYLTAP